MLAGALATLAGMATSAPGAAAVACSFTGSAGAPPGIVAVELSSPADSATLALAAGSVTVDGRTCSSAPLLGETATPRNTEVVRVRDDSGGPVELRIVDPAGFAPGLLNEGDGSAEVEFDVDLGAGPGDIVRIEAGGPDAEDRFRLGNYGPVPAANVNARSESGRSEDVDIGLAGAERIVADGRALDDEIDAAGGGPFSAPLATDVELFGFDGGDVLGGGAGRDLVHGGGGDDLLAGGAERDVLLGDGEEDVLAGGAGADRLDGGDDDDIADYRVLPDRSDRGIVADLRGGSVGGAGGGDRLISVEGLLGSPGPDVVAGSAALNFIEGGGGDDRLDGAGESDALLGSAGDDILSGGSARDVLLGGAGADTIAGEIGKDIVVGGGGPDRIATENGVDVVDVSGGGRDLVNCGPGRDGYDADRRDRMRSCEVRLEIGA